MNQVLYRFASASSLLLILGSGFVACGGLDARKVTRGPAGAEAGETSLQGDGGSEASGGGSASPFGGDTFTGGAAPVLDGPPEVLQVDPVNDAAEASPTGPISLLFSEGLNPDTVTNDSIKVMDGAAQVAGAIDYSKVIATFTPNDRLSLLASYNVSVSTAITDVGGTPLKQAFASSFSVREGLWGKQESFLNEAGESFGVQALASDARGNTLFVWTQYAASKVDTQPSVFARWYRVDSGWEPPTLLENNDYYSPFVTVAVSPEGDAVVAWLEQDPNDKVVAYARRYHAGQWELAPQLVRGMYDPVFNSYSEPLVAAINGGQAIVAWLRVEFVAQPFDIKTALQVNSAEGMGPWGLVPFDGAVSSYTAGDNVRGVRATVDANGNALVIYHYHHDVEKGDYGDGVYYLRKSPTGAWQYPVKIAGSTDLGIGPELASDGDGAMAVWVHYDSPSNRYELLASRYTKAKQFANAVQAGDADLDQFMGLVPGAALVSDGKKFLVTWSQTVGNASNVLANQYDIATNTWDPLPSIVSDGVAQAGSSSVGIDAHGNALLLFTQEGANNYSNVMFGRFVATSNTWSVAEPLTAADSSFGSPVVSMGRNGVAAVMYGADGRNGQGGGTGGYSRIFK